MEVEIVKAYNDKIWYANRIGEILNCKKLKYGYLVLCNGYLFIHEKDGEVIKKEEINESVVSRVLNILFGKQLTWFEVHKEYVELFGKITTTSIKHKLHYLQRHGKIMRTNIVVKSEKNIPCKKWEIINR